jgi:hypothetical protein
MITTFILNLRVNSDRGGESEKINFRLIFLFIFELVGFLGTKEFIFPISFGNCMLFLLHWDYNALPILSVCFSPLFMH